MRVLLAFLVGLAICVLVGTVTLRIMRWRDDGSVAADWERLLLHADDAGFDPASVADLPEPARRWLVHAIEPGARLARSAEFRMEGEFVIAAAVPRGATDSANVARLVADEVVAPQRGFAWRVDLESKDGTISGAETFVDGKARRSFWRSFLPAREESIDLDRSLAGRAAVERVFLPTSLLPSAGVRWTALDADRAVASFDVFGHAFEVTITTSSEGRLVSATCARWGNDAGPRGGAWSSMPFTIDADPSAAEHSAAGITIPAKFAVSWGAGAERHEFLRGTIVRAAFR